MLGYAKYVLTHLSSVQWGLLGGLLLLLFFVQWCYRHVLYDERKPHKRTGTVANCGALVFITRLLWSTILLRTPGTARQANLIPLWSCYQGFLQGNDEIRWQIYFNILLFMPFGFFSYLGKARPLGRILLRGFLLSLLVEACQYLFCLGLFEWDDLLHNSFGCLMGSGCGKIVKRVGKLHRLHKTCGRK